jgi:hypothetical protein
MGPPIMVIVRGVAFAPAGHQRDGGQHRHGGLADRDHVHFGADVADEVLHVGHVVVEVERAGVQRHHAGIGPVGDEDLVVVQQALDGVAQQRRMVARQRRHHQHRGLLFIASSALALSVKRLKRSRRQNGFFIATCSCTATSTPSTVACVMPNGGFSYSLASRCIRSKPADTRSAIGVCAKRRQRVVVELGRRAGELRERRHQARWVS